MPSSTPYADLLDPKVLSRIGHLELVSLRLVDSILTGRHRSKHEGVFEFAEHRDYSAGDEIRLIDWRVYGKSDRYYIKRYEEETNLQVVMVLDASGSMEFGLSTLSKFDYARIGCACLSRLILRQRDAVGLAVVGNGLSRFVPPRAHAHHLQAVCDGLRAARPRATTALSTGLLEAARRIRRRGIFLIWTDAFSDREDVTRAVRQLRQRGHEAVLLHVLAPEETSFQFDDWSRFECLETDTLHFDLDPTAIRKEYLESFGRFMNDIQRDCRRLGCEYRLMSTARPLGDAVAEFLHRRMAMMKV
ncbi:MAG: DUF58 domain-containing protein [Planctomycetaceae bacterium]